MRFGVAVAVLLAAACGGGGGGGPLPPLEQAADLGLVRGDAPTRVTLLVENPFEEPADAEAGEEADGGPFAFDPASLPRELIAGGSALLDVVFTPPAQPAATHTGELTVRFRTEKGRERDVVLGLSARVETPAIALLTPVIVFPATLVGERATREALVQNRSFVTPVTVVGPGPLPPGVTSEFAGPQELVPGGVLPIPLAYEPSGPGAIDSEVDIVHGAGPPLRLRVTARADAWIPEQVTDFGSVPLSNGQTEWLEVDVPQDGISLSLEAVGPSSAVPGLLGLEGPGGRVYENEFASGAFLWTPGFEGVFAATAPNSDRTNVQLVAGGGVYRFRFSLFSGSATALDVRAIVENRPGAIADDGVLDLNLFFAPGLGIADPGSDPRVQEIIARVDEIFAQAGLNVGAVSYFQLGDSGYDSVSGTEFPDMLEESAIAPDRAMNVFFVEQAIGGGILGIAGALPGPAKNGTRVSGVMVDYDWGSDAAAGQVTAHEIGHYLGLFHTAESDGTHDIIDDTAECPASGTSAACPEAGGGYLMHWQYIGQSLPEITPGQARVILGHPLVGPAGAGAGLSALAQQRLPPRPLVVLPPGFCGTCRK